MLSRRSWGTAKGLAQVPCAQWASAQVYLQFLLHLEKVPPGREWTCSALFLFPSSLPSSEQLGALCICLLYLPAGRFPSSIVSVRLLPAGTGVSATPILRIPKVCDPHHAQEAFSDLHNPICCWEIDFHRSTHLTGESFCVVKSLCVDGDCRFFCAERRRTEERFTRKAVIGILS